jgi:thiol:disulfide interchange protein DsbD
VGPVLIALLVWLSTQFAQGEASYTKGFFLLATFGAGMSLPFLIMSLLIVRLNSIPSLGRYTPWAKHLGTLLMFIGSLFFIIPGFQALGLLNNKKVESKFKIYTLENKPQNHWSVIDFRADWCSACIELENETFTHFEVSPFFESGSGNCVRVDLTHNNTETQKIASQWEVVGLPTVLILNQNNEICSNYTLNGFEDAKAFKKRLQDAQIHCLPMKQVMAE